MDERYEFQNSQAIIKIESWLWLLQTMEFKTAMNGMNVEHHESNQFHNIELHVLLEHRLQNLNCFTGFQSTQHV